MPEIHILHIHSQHCRACGTEERISHLYIADAEGSNYYGRGQKLLPASTIGPITPVRCVELPRAFVPVCASCVGDRRDLGEALYAAWAETLKRKATEHDAPAPAGSKVTALEDLA